MTETPKPASGVGEPEVIEHRGCTVHLRKTGSAWAASVRWPKERPTTVAAGTRDDAIRGAKELIDERFAE